MTAFSYFVGQSQIQDRLFRIFPLLLFILCLMSRPGYTQIYNFKVYDTKDGLPQSSVYCFLQDRQGYLWFGTGGGACRFDGFNFIVYDVQSGMSHNAVYDMLEDTDGSLWLGTANGLSCLNGSHITTYSTESGLSSNTVRALFKDSHDTMWIGTSQGVTWFDGQQFHVVDGPPNLMQHLVRDICEDASGRLWFGTDGGGLISFDGTTWREYGDADGIRGKRIQSLLFDSKGRLWISSLDGGVCMMDADRVIQYSVKDGLTFNRVHDLCETEDGAIWISSDGGGVSRFDGARFRNYTTQHGLPGNTLQAIYQDRERNLWFGTIGSGAAMFRGDFMATYTTDHGLLVNDVEHIAEDPSGTIWVGTWGGGIARFHADRFESYTHDNGLAGDRIGCVTATNNGNLWIGTIDDGLSVFAGGRFKKYSTDDGIPSNQINAICEAGDGTVWIGGRQGGIVLYDGRSFQSIAAFKSISRIQIDDIRVDHAQNVWVGTHSGLFRFNGRMVQALRSNDGLVNDEVRSICIDSTGTVWSATAGGVSGYRNDQFTHISDQQGLASNDCKFVVSRLPYLYIGTDRGISRFDMRDGTCRNFDVRHGLASGDVNLGGGFIDSRGHVWIGTTGGVTRLTPEAYPENHVPPPVYLTGMTASEKTFTAGGPYVLHHDENTIRFDFLGLCLTDPREVSYRYRLEGLDTEWQATRERSAVYTRLPAGEYRFSVQARNNDGVWSTNAACVDVSITPPFWSLVSFRLASGAALLGLIIGVHRTRTRMYKNRSRKLEQAVEDRTRELLLKAEALQEATHQLEHARDELDAKVQERTKDLKRAIDQLQGEIEDRRTAEQRLKSLASQMTLLEERQRRTIAAGLHDRIGQSLAYARMHLEQLAEGAPANDMILPPDKLVTLLDQIIEDTRSLSLELSPPVLYDFGLEAAVQWLIRQAKQQHGLEILLEDDHLPKPLREDVRILVFSAIRELIVNVTKHAKVHAAMITLGRSNDHLVVRLSDDGVGCAMLPAANQIDGKGGFGLYSIRERITGIGGKFTVKTSLGLGFTVVIEAPLNLRPRQEEADG